LIRRRLSKSINIGNVSIGGTAPIAVQSMTKTDTRNVEATVSQIRELADCGCEIVRVAIPDIEAAEALLSIKQYSPIPIIADIHFDYRLAIASLNAGCDGLRLNPGNIGSREKISEVIKAARDKQVPVRIGVNAGSLPKSDVKPESIPQYMVDVALKQVELLEKLDFNLIKISLKAFDVPTTIESYRLIAPRIPYPLHLGITESGLTRSGLVRSAVGIGILLYEGIGDTIRVSLSTDPREEVLAAYEILKSLNLRQHGPVLISCPSCGRCEVNLLEIAEEVDNHLKNVKKPLKVAVMGCAVNGPGEAREADIGIACGKGKGLLFKKGKIIRSIPEQLLVKTLIDELDALQTLD
jgi:(E)-4-hydroxy-3-methylbut-2-enyl-diphosphate synthase